MDSLAEGNRIRSYLLFLEITVFWPEEMQGALEHTIKCFCVCVYGERERKRAGFCKNGQIWQQMWMWMGREVYNNQLFMNNVWGEDVPARTFEVFSCTWRCSRSGLKPAAHWRPFCGDFALLPGTGWISSGCSTFQRHLRYEGCLNSGTGELGMGIDLADMPVMWKRTSGYLFFLMFTCSAAHNGSKLS